MYITVSFLIGFKPQYVITWLVINDDLAYTKVLCCTKELSEGIRYVLSFI